MLCITRRLDERLIVSDRETGAQLAEFTVIEIIDGGRVRLGIEAPPGISVDRPEIFQSKQKERLAAAGVGGE